jgi:hypothetical protein
MATAHRRNAEDATAASQEAEIITGLKIKIIPGCKPQKARSWGFFFIYLQQIYINTIRTF